MQRKDNYALQVQDAKGRFLDYDQETLIQKLRLEADETFLYTKMLCKPYRIHRATGDLQRLEDTWVAANSHAEVMTLLDLVCDSKEYRWVSGRWQNMTAFGLQFHQNLAESRDAFAERIDKNPQAFIHACEALGGTTAPAADISFALPFFEDLRIGIQFWAGDEEFAPRVRWLWDENALMYLKYETMWFALGMVRQRILEKM